MVSRSCSGLMSGDGGRFGEDSAGDMEKHARNNNALECTWFILRILAWLSMGDF